jgi:uncharacterized phage protein (TIGR02220 family)
MAGDHWLKLHTALLTSAKFVNLPSNDHRLAFICLLLLAKKGLESAPESFILAHVFLAKKRWKTVQRDLINSGLLNEAGKVNGFEDSQLSPEAWRKRRQRERDRGRDQSCDSHADSPGDCRLQIVECREEEEKKEAGARGPAPDVALVKAKKSRPQDPAEAQDVAEIIAHLNLVTGRTFRPAGTHPDLRRALRRDGLTVDEAKQVIDLKQHQWGDNPKMKGCVNPTTLFRPSNLPNYLEEVAAGPAPLGQQPATEYQDLR